MVSVTFTDVLIPYYVWFKFGFYDASLPIALLNFVTIVVVLFTQKGIEIPTVVIPVIASLMIVGCTFWGWFLQHYGISERMASYLNQNQNPEIREIHESIIRIERKLGAGK